MSKNGRNAESRLGVLGVRIDASELVLICCRHILQLCKDRVRKHMKGIYSKLQYFDPLSSNLNYGHCI